MGGREQKKYREVEKREGGREERGKEEEVRRK